MDSQLTLVDPARAISLVFDINSMLYSTLFLNSRPAYTIFTPPEGSPTEICVAGTSELLVRITYKPILPDTICFPDTNGGKGTRLSKWLRRCTLPDGLYVTRRNDGLPAKAVAYREVHAIDTEVGKFLLKRDLRYRLAVRSISVRQGKLITA
jgi:hypothetical protein